MKIVERVKHFKELIPLYLTTYQRNTVLALTFVVLSIASMAAMGAIKVKREQIRRDRFFTLLKEYETTPTPETLDALVTKALSSSFLKKQYASALLQEEIYAGNENLAKKLLANLSQAKNSNMDWYLKFSKTTFDISKKRYQEALVDALSLEKELIESGKEKEFFALSTLNDLRIALLYQKLEDKSQERLRYQKIINDNDKLAFLNSALHEGKLTFSDYIEYRMK